jgi:hypothetical protein
MANLLNITEIDNKLIKVKNGNDYHRKTYHIDRKDKKTINSILFQDIYNNFSKTYSAEKVMVRALCNTGLFTFKGFNENSLNFQHFHEYFQNRVKDTDNYEYFYSMEITVIK